MCGKWYPIGANVLKLCHPNKPCMHHSIFVLYTLFDVTVSHLDHVNLDVFKKVQILGVNFKNMRETKNSS